LSSRLQILNQTHRRLLTLRDNYAPKSTDRYSQSKRDPQRIYPETSASSGEINTQVASPLDVIERVAAAYSGAAQDRLDGLTVDCGAWWFNLRPSNTEPLLRLNLEAPDRDECDRRVAEVLVLVAAG
jgi:phosphomannomutase